MNGQHLTRLALLISIGAILHWVEGFIPAPLPVPGAKLGLANVVTILAVSSWGLSESLYVASGRCLIGSLLGGTFGTQAFAMSLAGALTAAVTMWLISHLRVTTVGTSITGAASHNLAQLSVFYLITRFGGVWSYVPPLLLLSVPAGLITGLVAYFSLNHLHSIVDSKTCG